MRKIHALSAVALLPLLWSDQRGAAAHEEQERPQVKLSRELLQKTVLCTDDKSHYVAITPDDSEKGRYTEVYYGDGKRFFQVPGYKGLTRTLFRDPRFYNKRAPGPGSPMGREVDFRLVSGVKNEEGKCSFWCGERTRDLKVVDAKRAEGLLTAARFEPSPRRYQHHALARDDQGNYYYVDHAFFGEQKASYRLFVGPKGGLKQHQITGVTSDSEGEFIMSKAGNLRVARFGAKWTVGEKSTALSMLPLSDDREENAKNVLLVYNELGVYKGERLGTPCDDL